MAVSLGMLAALPIRDCGVVEDVGVPLHGLTPRRRSGYPGAVRAPRAASLLLVGLEPRGLDDRPPALVVGALDSSQFLARRPRYVEAEAIDPGPDLGILQGVEDCCTQALGNVRGRACRGVHSHPIRCHEVEA